MLISLFVSAGCDLFTFGDRWRTITILAKMEINPNYFDDPYPLVEDSDQESVARYRQLVGLLFHFI